MDRVYRRLKRLPAAAKDRNGSRLGILALLTAAQNKQTVSAQASLEEALRLGEPEGYLRTFLDAGEPLRQALSAWIQFPRLGTQESMRAYAIRILSAFDRAAAPTASETSAAAILPEPLTPRELDVLRLLTEGCSNKKIAESLILAEGTVKFYVHTVLEKLQVHSRTQAIARARELNLV